MSLIQKALRTKIKVKKLSRLQKVQKTRFILFLYQYLVKQTSTTYFRKVSICKYFIQEVVHGRKNKLRYQQHKNASLQVVVYVYTIQHFIANFQHARICVANSNWEMASCKLLSYKKLRLKKKTSLENSCAIKKVSKVHFSLEKFNEKYEHVTTLEDFYEVTYKRTSMCVVSRSIEKEVFPKPKISHVIFQTRLEWIGWV